MTAMMMKKSLQRLNLVAVARQLLPWQRLRHRYVVARPFVNDRLPLTGALAHYTPRIFTKTSKVTMVGAKKRQTSKAVVGVYANKKAVLSQR